MSFTFTQLKTAIQDYVDNSETTFVNHLSDFIKASEERIFKNVDLELFRKNVTSAMTSSDKFVSIPSDYLSSFSLQITTAGSEGFLLQKDVNFLQEAFDGSASTGLPRYYAVFDINNFIVAPTPNSNYAIELHYYYRPASLTAGADGGTTWLSINAELSLLYGSLIEAYTFMKGEQDVMAMYNQKFQESLMGIKMLGEAKEVTDEFRTGKIIRQKQ